MAQRGSASALGAEGRRFESGYPDHGMTRAPALPEAQHAARPAALEALVHRAAAQVARHGTVDRCPLHPDDASAREQRAAAAAAVAADHGGVAHRRDLRARGVTRDDVRSEVTAGRWATAGRHTVVIGSGSPVGEALWWQALWETGAGAAL